MLHVLLESLEQQRYPSEMVEVLVVASTNDPAFELVRKYQARGKLKLLCMDVPHDVWQGRNPSAKRNYGVHQATGEWIAFIDDDCVASPSWIAGAVQFFEQPNVGAVEGRTEIPAVDPPTLTYKGLCSFTKAGGYQTCNMFYKRDVFLKVKGFDINFPFYLEDTDLAWTVLDNNYEIPFASEAIVFHPVSKPAPWRLLDDAKRTALLPYLFKKHPIKYRATNQHAIRLTHWLYLALYVAFILTLVVNRIEAAILILMSILILLAVHVWKLFRGCKVQPDEFLITTLLLPILPFVRLIQLVRGNLQHRVWLWT